MILGYRDPDDFKNSEIGVIYHGKYHVAISDEQMSFADMIKLRKQHCDPEIVRDKLLRKGCIFANMGVSAMLTMTLSEEDYVLGFLQRRYDLDDEVVKLVSGYVNSRVLETPRDAIDDEISEEILPVTREGKLIRFSRGGIELPKPFGEHYDDHSGLISLNKPARFETPGLVGPVAIHDSLISDSPDLYFQIPSNSVQLVFSYHLDLNGMDFEELGVSMLHSEDKLVGDRLEINQYSDVLYLFKLENGDLTDQVFIMNDGKLFSVNPRRVLLSQAFAEKPDGIAEIQSITLLDYLKEI